MYQLLSTCYVPGTGSTGLAGRRFLAVLFHVIPPQVYDIDMASSVVYTENETHNQRNYATTVYHILSNSVESEYSLCPINLVYYLQILLQI